MNGLKDFFWNNKWGLSLTSGILLGLSFPPLPFPFLAFPAFIMIFRLIDLCPDYKSAAFWAYPGFVVWNLITTYWLMMASPAAGIAAILANSVVMTIPVMLQHKIQEKAGHGWLIALLQASVWVSIEYLHHHWDLAWPWLSLGNAWSEVPSLVQYISATGYLGISFWILFTASLFYRWIKESQKSLLYGAVGCLLFFPAVSLVQYAAFTPGSGSRETAEVVVAQPNFDSYQEYGRFETPYGAVNHLLTLSDSLRTAQTDLVIWPENGIHPFILSEGNINSTADSIRVLLIRHAGRWNTPILGGSTYFEYYTEGEAPKMPRLGQRGPWLAYNAALGFYPDSSLKVYRKHNLVPIVERVPFARFLNSLDVFNWLNLRENQGFGKGRQADAFPVAGTSTPALVCYDSVFPSWVKQFVQGGSGFISVITNDGWWGNTSGHHQHFAYARLRAIEFRRWVVRSANNGISGIIAPDGSVKVKTEYWTEDAFRYRIPIRSEMTVYALLGDWMPASLLIISVLGLAWISTSSFEEEGINPNE